MDAIATFIDRQCRPIPASLDLQDFGILQWGRSKRFTAIVLDGDALVLDYKYFVSFRIRLPNLTNIPHPIYYSAPTKAPFSSNYIREYFQDNNDNPYGIRNYLSSCCQPERREKLTQFPPLHYPKDTFATSLERLQKLALPGDSVFIFDRNSGLSRRIRKYDRGMWSHVAMVSDLGTLYESTLQGTIESEFSGLGNNLDVALYRVPDITQPEREKMVAWVRSRVGKTRYNWRGVIRIYLNKWWGIPYRRRPTEWTPADLMYENIFDLVAYA